MNRAHTGYGAELQRGDGNSPENFVTVAGIKNITGPSMQRDTHDTTSNDNADDEEAGNYRTFIGGLVDGGEITFEGNFLPMDDTQNQTEGGLMAEFDLSSCDSVRRWRLTVPGCAGDPEIYLESDAVLTALSLGLPMDDIMPFNGTFKVSGRPELHILSA
jgi:hypothetical protein